jgi:hypothetical protein
MSTVVKNVGPIELGPQNQQNTNLTKARGEIGTVRIVLSGVEYVWGPNEAKTLPDNLGSEAVAASGGRLRVMDSRDHAGTALRT